MKSRLAAGATILFLVFGAAGGKTMIFGQSAGSSPASPAAPGVTLAGIVECGQGYTSHELYDMKITLLEVVRGAEAWKRIQAADRANQPAGSGSEYVLAHIKFEYYARGNPGLCVHELKPQQFTAYAADGSEYPAPAITLPTPALNGSLHSGQSLEGWVAFSISQQDKKPLMSYSADIGGAIEHGGGKWFQLR
jgi:hypothetical protein